MPDTKVAGLNAITQIDTALDFIPIVDVSDPQMAISGTTKKITISQILAAGTNLVIPAGTAGAPSISFSGDSNTGIYAPAADQLAISAGGSGKATVTATGLDITGNATVTGNLTVDTNTLVVDAANNRLGIGTATPDSLLHLEYPSTCNWKLRNSGSGVHIASYAGSSLGTIGTISNNDFYLFTNNTERIRLASDGVCTWSNVGGVVSNAMVLNGTGLGVGVSPLARVHSVSNIAAANHDWTSQFVAPTVGLLAASNDSSAWIRIATYNSNPTHDPYLNFLTSGGQNWSIGIDNSDSDKLKVAMAAGFSGSNEFLTIDSTGNVGIGTTTPQSKLSVETSGIQNTISPVITAQSTGTTYAGMYSVRDGAGDQRGLVWQVYTANVGLGEKMRLDSSGNLGLGVTPSAWQANWKVLQFANGSSIGNPFNGEGTFVGSNAYRNSSGDYIRLDAGFAALYLQLSGSHRWHVAGSSTAGSTIPSFSTGSHAMILDSSGNLAIGKAIASYKLEVVGATDTAGISLTTAYGVDAEKYAALRFTNSSFGGGHSEIRNVVNGSASLGSSLTFLTAVAETGNLAERLRITSGGNVGIGVTPASGARIHVADSQLNSYAYFQNNQALAQFRSIQIVLANGPSAFGANNRDWRLFNVATSSTASDFVVDYWNGTAIQDRIRITSDGNLRMAGGNGTKLTWASDASSHFVQFSSTLNGLIVDGYDAVQLQTRATPRLTVDSAGNVGINETAPISKLHVKGTGVNIVSIVDSSATGYSGLTFKGTGTQAYTIGVGGPSENAFSVANNFYIYDGLAGTMRLRIDPVGNFLLTSKTISVGNLWPKYSVFFGGAQDLNWKKIADITFGTSLYSGATLRVEVTDANTNFGGNAGCIPLTYFVCCIRSGAVLNDTDTAVVTGPVAEYVRVVKTALGVFELQVRQPNDWKHMTFTAQAISVGGGAQTVINYVNGVPQNGSTTGTIYTATAGWTQSFPNVSVSGNLTSGYGTFAAPAYVVGDSQYGIYANSGILYYKNSSAGAHYWRNTTNTANLMSLDPSGNFLVGPGGAQYTAANRGNITVAGTSEALFGLSVNNTPSGYLWGTTTNVEIGAPAGRYITFSINGEKVRVQNDGNVGIGLNGATAIGRLHVDVTSASACSAILAKMGGGDPDFKLVARNGFGAAGNSESARFGLEYQPASSSGTWNSGFRFLRGGGASDGSMVACTSGQDRVWFDVAGNLGIGVAPSGQGGAGHLHMPNSAAILGRGKALSFITNGYFDTQWRVYADGNFTQYYANDGIHYWYNGTGTVASGFSSGPNLAMSLDMSNNLFVAGSLTTGYAVRATAAGQPVVSLNRSGNGLNEKYVEWTMYDSTFRGRIVNDAYSAASDFMTVARSGITVTNITFPGSAVTVSGTLNAANGTAAAPSITFTSDTNTGIYRPGTDIVALATNGTERLRADASGNVVVNTAAVATNATSGFLWIPSCAGTPTGAPTAPYTNAAAMVWDRTNKKLYVYDGSWNEALPPV